MRHETWRPEHKRFQGAAVMNQRAVSIRAKQYMLCKQRWWLEYMLWTWQKAFLMENVSIFVQGSCLISVVLSGVPNTHTKCFFSNYYWRLKVGNANCAESRTPSGSRWCHKWPHPWLEMFVRKGIPTMTSKRYISVKWRVNWKIVN